MSNTSYNGYTIGTDTGTANGSTTAYITVRYEGTGSAGIRWRFPVTMSCSDGSFVCATRAQRGVTPQRRVKLRKRPALSRRGIVRL